MDATREQLFEVLVREHLRGVFAFVRSCVRDRQAADDIVQETLVTAWRRIDEYDKERPFAAWLRGIAKNKIAAYARKWAGARFRERVLTTDQIDGVASEFEVLIRPSRGDVGTESLAALGECLKTLFGQDREIVERAYDRDESCSTIAHVLGYSVEAIKKRLQRARAHLRDCILGKLAAEHSDG